MVVLRTPRVPSAEIGRCALAIASVFSGFGSKLSLWRRLGPMRPESSPAQQGVEIQGGVGGSRPDGGSAADSIQHGRSHSLVRGDSRRRRAPGPLQRRVSGRLVVGKQQSLDSRPDEYASAAELQARDYAASCPIADRRLRYVEKLGHLPDGQHIACRQARCRFASLRCSAALVVTSAWHDGPARRTIVMICAC
jgi:hypothetical protein